MGFWWSLKIYKTPRHYHTIFKRRPLPYIHSRREFQRIDHPCNRFFERVCVSRLLRGVRPRHIFAHVRWNPPVVVGILSGSSVRARHTCIEFHANIPQVISIRNRFREAARKSLSQNRAKSAKAKERRQWFPQTYLHDRSMVTNTIIAIAITFVLTDRWRRWLQKLVGVIAGYYSQLPFACSVKCRGEEDGSRSHLPAIMHKSFDPFLQSRLSLFPLSSLFSAFFSSTLALFFVPCL